MPPRETAKFGQTLEVVDGRSIYTVPGKSADFEWKLTPGSSALLWTDADYDVLDNCQEIRFDDLSISIDSAGQLSSSAGQDGPTSGKDEFFPSEQDSSDYVEPVTALQEGATRIVIAKYLPEFTGEAPVVTKAWASHGEVQILPDGDLSYRPHDNQAPRDDITFVVHDGHWSTQVMKIRIENQMPIQELGNQLIPNQFDGMDTHVSLDIGGYLADLLVDENVSVSVSGLPPGLNYNTSRMHIEGVLSSDGGDGENHTVLVSIATSTGQVMSTQFKWIIQSEKGLDTRDVLNRGVLPAGSQSDAAAAAVLYSVASQAAMSAQGFSLTAKSVASQSNSSNTAKALELAQIGSISGESGHNSSTGSEAQNLLDLSSDRPVTEEEDNEEDNLQLDDTAPAIDLSQRSGPGQSRSSSKSGVDLAQDSAIDVSAVGPAAANEAPFAGIAPAVGTPEDVGLFGINVLNAAYDPEGDSLTVTGAIASNGTATINADGTLDYIPDPDFHGSDAIAYTITDTSGNITDGSIAISVLPVNDAPIAGTVATGTTDEDTTLSNIDALALATDIDGDSLSVVSASATNGSVTINPDGTLNFTPNSDFFGTDTITYTISDGNGGIDSSTFNVVVNSVNDAPRLIADSDIVLEDGTVVIDVLSNDTDIDGSLDPASVQIVGTPTPGAPLFVPGQGTWSVNLATGEISFTPIADYDGPVTDINYTVADNLGARSSQIGVSVSITPVNDAPIAVADSDTVLEDGSVTIAVLSNDIDIDGTLDPTSLQIIGTTNPGDPLVVPGEGTWSVNLLTGEITFAPLADYDGPVTDISYQMSDNTGAVSNPVNISVSITPVNDAPVAVTDGGTVVEDGSTTIDILTNDFDIDGTLDPASIQIAGTSNPGDPLIVAGEGTWSVNLILGQITFTPIADYHGSVTDISYTVRDDVGDISNPINISVTITDVNDAPTANADSDIVAEDASVTIDVLANDTDIDGIFDPASVQITGTASAGDPLIVAGEGTWSVNNLTGEITFTPETDFDGAVTDITYTVQDDDGAWSNPASVSVTITGSNDAPVAGSIPDSNTNEDTSLGSIDVLSFVTDAEGDIVSVTAASALNGSVTINGDGSLNYTPNADYNGTDTISFTLDDGNGGISAGNLDIIVAPVNDDPLAGSPPLSNINEDNALNNINVLIHASDIDGDVLSVTTAGSTNGTVTINPDSSLNYTPNLNFNGLDTITYTVDDGNGGTVVGTKFIFVNAVNDAPVANDDVDSVVEDGSVAINILGNDSDLDGTLDPASIHITGTASAGDPLVVPGEGTWTINTATGEITFTPEPDYTGPVTDISYTVEDNSGAVSNPATVSVTITSVNDIPVAVADSDTVVEDGSVIIDVLANDSDLDGTLMPATVQISGTASAGDPLAVPGEGAWTINTLTGEITFTPEADYDGSVTDITYTVQDDLGATSIPATVSVTITSVNDVPVAIADIDSVVEDSSININVLANDSDLDGTLVPATVQITGTASAGDPLVVPGEGVWTINTLSGEIIFTPEPNYDGAVTDITYTVQDDLGANSNPATVSVTITPVNDAPTAVADSDTVAEDSAVTIDVLANDSDLDGTLIPATVQIVGTSSAGSPLSIPGEGTWSINPATGEITFTPVADYDGAVTDITYTVQDDLGATSNPASVSVTITSTNDAPVAVADSGGVVEDSSVTIDVLGNDIDIDGTLVPATVRITGTASPGDPLTVPGEGTWSVNTLTGEIMFAPEADFDGAVTDITYTVEDDLGATSNPATVSVSITPVNDAPVANVDADTVVEDNSITIDVLGNDVDIDGTLVPATVQITGTASAGDPLTVPGEGTWSVNMLTGEITFTPEADYDGTVNDITYTVEDNAGAVSNAATVSVNITPANDAPILDLSDVENIIVNGSFSDGVSPNWANWSETGNFDGADAGANAPAVTNHDTNGLATVTQTGLSGLSTGPGANGAALVSFDFGWSDHNHESESIQITMSVAGVDYARITTSSGPGTTTSVTYLNGATGPATIITSSEEHDWDYYPVEVNLPAGVSDTGDITFSWLNLNPTGDHTDEASIDNVMVFVADSNSSDIDTQLPYTAGDPPVQLLDVSSSITDVDGTTIQSARIVLTNAEVGDRLLVDGSVAGNGSSGTVNGLAWSSSISGVTVQIDITGAATHADYLTALSLLEFENTDSNPVESARTIDMTVNDGIDDSAVAQAFILLGVDVNPPDPTDDIANGFEDVPLVIDVLANDIAGDDTIDASTVQLQDTANAGDSLIVAGEGTWSINAVTGEITFTGEPEFSGVPTPIRYSVSDINGMRSKLAQVSVTIVAVNDPPVAINDSDSVAEDASVIIDVLANDSDIDGTLVPATVQITGTASAGDPLVVPGEGTWTVNTLTGEITFTPEADYSGIVTDITYTVQDDSGATSNPASVSVSITGANDAPVAVANADTVSEDGAVVIDVLANDSDVDGTLIPATVQITGTASAGAPLVVPGQGTWSVNGATGEITFTPELDYVGPVTDITYTVQDNLGATSNPATVSVSITSVNDTPVIDLSDYENSIANSSFSSGTTGNWTGWSASGSFTSGGVSPNSPAVNNDTLGPVATLTQTGVSGLSDGPGSNGTALVRFDLGWNNVIGPTGNPQQLTLSIGGVDYATITTSLSGSTASVLFLNGASGSPSTISESTYFDWTYTTIELNLPGSVADTADIQFTWENLPGPGSTSDDISIDNVQVIVNDANPAETDHQVDYQNGNAPIDLLDSSSSITDIDGTTLQSAHIHLTIADNGDALIVDGVTVTNGGSGTVNGLAWTSTISGGEIDISITGVGTHVTYLDALKLVQFESNSATPVATNRIVDFTVNDGIIDSVAAQTFVLFGINDAPPNSVDDMVNGFEDIALVINVLANDTPGDDPIDPTTVHILGTTNPGDSLVVAGEGTWSVNAVTGEITFTGEPEYSGLPTPIEYTVSDTSGLGSKLAQVIATIAAVNDDPVTALDSDTVVEDGSVVIDVLANDSDIDGTLDPATVQITGTASAGDPLVVAGEGTWTVNSINGEITFTPEPDFAGAVTDITYTVDDNLGATSNPATVSVTITPVNDAPAVNNDSDTVVEDGSVIIDVLANDSDVDGTLVPATVQITGTASAGDPLVVAGEGTWTVNSINGEITFTPEPDFDGAVTSITYTVDDNLGATSSPATVSVTITPVNDAPVAANDTSSGPINVTQTIVVLANDSDIDGGPLQVVSATATNGSVGVNPDNTLSYTPNLNYSGPDTISYTVSDGAGGSDTASVSVTVGGTNMPPQVDLDSTDNTAGETFADDFESGNYSGSTGSSAWTSNWVEIGEANGPSSGDVQIVSDGGDNSIRLTEDAIERTLDLSTADSAELTFDLRRTGDWDEDGRFRVEVSTDGTNYTQIYTTSSGGSTYQGITLNLTPYMSATTHIRFELVQDEDETAFIDNVSVAAVYPDPTPYSGTFTEDAGGVQISDLSIVTDIDSPNIQSATITITNVQTGDVLSVFGALPPGIAAGAYNPGTGELTLTGSASPADYQTAIDQIRFENTSDDPVTTSRTISVRVNDGAANSNVAIATIAIVPVNDPPVASNDADTVVEDSFVAVSVLANDNDVDGTLDPATVQITGTASAGDPLVVAGEGTWTVNTISGVITFTPEPDYEGTVTSITYTVQDDLGATSNPATVSMSLTPANDAPTAMAVAGNTGTAINVDGGDAAYFKPDNSGAILGGLTQFTIETQFTNTNSTTAQHIPIFNYFDGGPTDELEITIFNASTTPYILVEISGSILSIPAGTYDPSTLLDGGQHTLSFSWDNTAGDWVLYEDGVQVANGTGLNPAHVLTGGGVAVFGQEQDSLEGNFNPAQIFAGSYYDVRIFDDIRTPAEVAAGSNITLSAAEPNMVANWQFNDGETSTVTDVVSGNNLNLLQSSEPGFTASTPADIISVVENSASGTVIGTFTTTDIDIGDTFTYALTSDPSGLFEIVGDELRIKTGATVDYEVSTSHSVTVEVTDSGGATFSRNVTIEVTNVDEITRGTAIWGDNTNEAVANDWDGSTYGSDVTTVNIGDEFRTMQAAEAPTRDEIIVVGTINNKDVVAQMWDGSTWAQVSLGVLGQVSEAYWWGAEVAYEQTSGDAVMVWNDDGQSSGQELRYATWDGSSWSAVQSVSGYTGNEPQHMKLSFDPNSDEMVLVVNDKDADDYAFVWDGNSWGNMISLDTSGNSEADQTAIAVSHEAESGDAIVTFGKSGSTDIFTRTWDGASWSSESSLSAPVSVSGDPRWIVTSNDLSSDSMVVGVTTDNGEAWVSVWDGSSWETAVEIETFVESAISPNIAVAFESISGQALVTYSEDGTNTVHYRTWDSVGGWSAEQVLFNAGDRINSMTLDSSPTSNEIMLMVQDDGHDLNSVIWDGSSWGTPTELENDTGENKNQPFAFVWDQDGVLNTSPLAFDLNRDGEINVTGETTAQNKAGIRELGETVQFDTDGDGDLETIEWLDGSGDALLVNNVDGNAATDMNGTRLFGDQGGEYEHGYQQLAEFDSNSDGVISQDEGEGLNLWVDDGDAKVSEGELFTLQEMGISEIELTLEAQAQDEEGRDLFRSSATLEDGTKILTEDVWFGQATSEDDEPLTRPDLTTVQQPEDLLG